MRVVISIATLAGLLALMGCAAAADPGDGGPGTVTAHMRGQVVTSFGASWR